MINKDCIFPQVPLRTLNRTLESEDEGLHLHWNVLKKLRCLLLCWAAVLLYSDHKRVQLCGTKTTSVCFVVCLCESSNLQTVCTLLLHDLLLKESNHVTVYLWNANLRGVERVYTNQSSLVKAVIRYSTLCFIRSLHENTRPHLYKTYFCKGRSFGFYGYFVKTEIKINIIFENYLWLCPASYFWVWYCM